MSGHATAWRLALTFLLLLGASQASAATPDPSTIGPYDVGTAAPIDIIDTARGNRTLPIHIWWPSDDTSGSTAAAYLISGFPLNSTDAFTDAPGSTAGPFPLLVFSHGSGGLGLQSWRTMEVLASHGFVVATLEHVGNTALPVGTNTSYENVATDRPKDVSFVIDSVLALAADNTKPYYGLIDADKIGVLGHSFGGYTSLAMVAGYVDGTYGAVAPDPRVDAIMPIAGVTSLHTDPELEGIVEPSLFLGGSLDTAVPIDPQTTRAMTLMATNGTPLRADILGANHNHFAAVCDLGQLLIDAGILQAQWASLGAGALIVPYNTTCIPEVLDIDEAVRLQNLYSVSFFRRTLLEDQRYAPFLTEGYATTEPLIDFYGALPMLVLVPVAGGSGIALLSTLIAVTAWRRARSVEQRG